MNGVIQILAAMLGSCGFAIVFQIQAQTHQVCSGGRRVVVVELSVVLCVVGNSCRIDVFGGCFGDGVFRSDGQNR